MTEDKNKEFDLKIRSLMESAEEDVPSRVWDAIDSRLPRREPALVPVWAKFTAAAFAAAAAIVLTINVTGLFSSSEFKAGIENAENKETLRVAETVSVDAIEDIPNIVDATVPVVSRHISAATAPVPVPEIIPQDENPAPEEEETSASIRTDATENRPEKKKQADNAAGIEMKDMTQEQLDALFEDSPKKETKRISLDAKGIFGSNDGVSRKSFLTGAWAAPTKANTFTTGISETGTSVYSIPISFNLEARYYLTDKLSLGTGLIYSRLTRTFTGNFTKANEASDALELSIENAEIVNHQHYIGIPVNLYYDFLQNELITFYGFGGAALEKGLVDNYRITGKSAVENYRKPISGIQPSLVAGLGIQFRITEDWGIFLDPSARYYFDCGQPSSVRTAKPFMFNFEVGIRFDVRNR